MREALAAAIAIAFIVAGSPAVADTAYITIWPGDNWVAPPLVPFNADPSAVFAGLDIDGNLTRFDAVTQTPLVYDSANPMLFGGILLGDGYKVSNSGQGPVVVSYQGAPDGLPGPDGRMTDMWISLPNGGHGAGGVTWVGHPFNHDVYFDHVFVTDGTQTVLIGTAVGYGWIEGLWTTLDGQTQQAQSVGLRSLHPDDAFLRPGSMYEVTSYVDSLALIVPAYPIPEPSSLLALVSALAAVGGMIRRKTGRTG